MKRSLADHARSLIDELARRRDAENRIQPVTSVEVLRTLGRDARAGKVLGNAVALVDAACTLAQRPWLGRLVQFGNPKDDFVGPWESWVPFKNFIVSEAPRSMRWRDEDLESIKSALEALPPSPDAWWAERKHEGDRYLLSVLLVALEQACWPRSGSSKP